MAAGAFRHQSGVERRQVAHRHRLQGLPRREAGRRGHSRRRVAGGSAGHQRHPPFGDAGPHQRIQRRLARRLPRGRAVVGAAQPALRPPRLARARRLQRQRAAGRGLAEPLAGEAAAQHHAGRAAQLVRASRDHRGLGLPRMEQRRVEIAVPGPHPAGGLDELRQALRIARAPARITPDGAAGRQQQQRAGAGGDLHAAGRDARRLVPAALPDLRDRQPVAHRVRHRVRGVAQQRQGLGEGQLPGREVALVRVHVALAAEGVGRAGGQAAAGPAAALLRIQRAVHQVQRLRIAAAAGQDLAERGLDLRGQAGVTGGAGQVQRRLGLVGPFAEAADGVLQVAQPVAGARDAQRLAAALGQQPRALEHGQAIGQGQRVEDAGVGELGRQADPARIVRGRAARPAVDRLQRAAVQAPRRAEREGRDRTVPRPLGRLRGPLPVAGAARVVGQGLVRVGQLGGAGRAGQQPGLDAPVQVGALIEPGGLDHRLARHPVLEAEQAAGGVGVEEVGIGQQLQHGRVRRAAADLGQQRHRAGRADHRRGAHQRRGGRRQPLQARGHQPAEPAGGRGPAVQRLPQRLRGRRQAQLLDEQRHAAGVVVDAAGEEGVGIRQPQAHRLRGLGRVERRHRQVRAVGHPGQAVLARAGRQQHARAVGRLQQAHQQAPAGIVGPLPVVDHEQRRAGLQAQPQLVVHVRDVVRGLAPAEHLHEGLQQAGAALRLAMAEQQLPVRRQAPRQELLHQPGLAQPRAALHDDAARRRGAGEQLRQLAEQPLAADEGRQAAPHQRIEAARHAHVAQHLHHLGRAGGSRPRVRPQFEAVRVGPERVEAGEDAARRGVALQVRGHVHRIAAQVHPAALEVALGQQHDAGVQPGAQPQRHAGLGPQAVDRGMDLQRTGGRPAAVVLGRVRQAEHDQRAVALDAQHRAAVALRGRLPAPPHGRQQLGELLDLEPAGQRAGALQVGAQDRQAVAAGVLHAEDGRVRVTLPHPPVEGWRRDGATSSLGRKPA
ncbi:hypothetical protein ISF6_3013 [Piscinibacter sakaiensis]|uniref:Uncharacterized protein n=1 Tax=Piscinibacter sakaiensis TaxID=1547922 RepID=A0A0K8P3H3_PISS1|nr:hypothetical protein ISF6_3013 [Piscinibacter sakaiensis]